MPSDISSNLYLGSSWYPEMWPAEEWAKDAARMQELGFNMVRLFEFAWHRFEPREGEYNYEWAIEVLDQCHAHGVKVMVGTPTAAPPAWLTQTYPEVLQTDADGVRKMHGKRKHYNQHSEQYRAHSRRITQKYLEWFGDHPALHSWQIDNEMSGYDYGAETVRHFHRWLEEKFDTVEKMNETWGLEFWSQAYNSFDQVPMVVASVGSIAVPERNHPSLIMAIAEFQNEGWTRFIKEQVEILQAGSDKPVTTNMVGLVGGMDWFAHNKALDQVGASMYADRRYYHYNLSRFDRLRAEKDYRPYWLLETAPNWSGGGQTWNIHFDERGVHCFSWLSTLLGGSMVLYWQWREHWAGQEMLHGTCVTATGKWRPNKTMWQRIASEFKEQQEWLYAHPVQRAELAVVMSSEAAWAFSIDPTDVNMKYNDHFRDLWHGALCRAHLWRDVIHESADYSPYKVICLPQMPIVTQTSRKRLAEWVKAGGTLVLGPLTGWRSEEFTAFTDQEFGGFEAIMGAKIERFFTVQWVEDVVSMEFEDGHRTHSQSWVQSFAPSTATTLATWRGGYADGHPAVIDNVHGKGRVITIGGMVDEPTWGRLVSQACVDAGIEPVCEGGKKVQAIPRAGANGKLAGYGVVNLDTKPASVTLAGKGTDRLSGRATEASFNLEPFEVKIIELD
jgi:beta-galactosidase GanA